MRNLNRKFGSGVFNLGSPEKTILWSLYSTGVAVREFFSKIKDFWLFWKLGGIKAKSLTSKQCFWNRFKDGKLQSKTLLIMNQ
jgi:hypothetical protein